MTDDYNFEPLLASCRGILKTGALAVPLNYRYTADEMLIPFEMTANAAGMKWFKPLGFYGCSPDMTKAALEKAAKEYEESLLELL